MIDFNINCTDKLAGNAAPSQAPCNDHGHVDTQHHNDRHKDYAAAVVSAAHAGALRCAALDIPVFPLKGIVNGKCACGRHAEPGYCTPGKHPAFGMSFKDATTDPDIINGWFEIDPTLNYGVRTGVEIANTGKQLVVIDNDSYKGAGSDTLDALEATYGRLPETAQVLTGAGGTHHYFLANCNLSFVGKMGSNIDLKVNGYVVGPGSVHVSGRSYEWEASSDLFNGQSIANLPDWVCDHFSKATKATAPSDSAFTVATPLTPSDIAFIKHDLKLISAACSRDKWIKVVMALHSRSQCAQMYAIADEWSQTCPEKYDSAAFNSAWKSFKPDGGISYDYITYLAREEIAKSVDISKLLESLDRMPVKAQPAAMRYKLLTAEELANAAPLKWMIRGLLPQTGQAALYGPSGSGKSFLAIDLAATVAGGATDWYGMRVKNCPVTYCVLEGEGGMGKRAKAWQQYHGKALPDALRFVTQPINLLHQGDVQDLIAAINDAGGSGGLIILDTLNRAAPEADENASKDMGAIIAASKTLQASVGGLVMLVHHTGKIATAGMRGHSSLFAAMDAVISVAKLDSGTHWEVQKSKDDATGAQHPFRLEPLMVGHDDDGDEITSCVAVPVAPPLGLRKARSLGKHQQPALDTLQLLFVEADTPASGIQVDEAIAVVAAKLDVDQKHKRERAKDAIEALAMKGKIKIDEDFIFLISPTT